MAVGDFYAGALQPVFHVESLLLLLALALWAGQRGEPLMWRAPSAFLAAALLGAAAGVAGMPLPGSVWMARGAALGWGLLVAARLSLPLSLTLLLAALAGLAHGHQATFGEAGAISRPVLYVLGMEVGIALLTFHVVRPIRRFQGFAIQVGVRVAGSWIATITLLVTAFALVGPPSG